MIGYYYNKPMLVTAVGGLAEIVPDKLCGYSVPVEIDQISNCLIDYFEYGREKEFIQNVKEERKKYEWSGFINTLLNLYNRC